MGGRRSKLRDSQIARAMAGDQAEVKALALEFLPRVYGLALRSLRRQDLAEEATQEAFLKILEHLPNLRNPDRLDSWVLTIAGNVVRDMMRSKKVEAKSLTYDPPALDVEEDEPDHLRRKAVEQAISTLEPEERRLFLLHTVEGVRYRELARSHDTNENAMKARVHRIRAKVRTRARTRLEHAGALP